jgi:hypothetical protein
MRQKGKIIDLRIQHKRKIQEIVSEVGKSNHDITTISGNQVRSTSGIDSSSLTMR